MRKPSRISSAPINLDDAEKFYLPDTDQEFWCELELGLLRFTKEAEEAGSRLQLTLTRHRDTAWGVATRATPFDLKFILKSKKRVADDEGHSISRIVPLAIQTPTDSPASFLLTAEIVTLHIELGYGKSMPLHSVWPVEDGGFEKVISAFIDAPRRIRQETFKLIRAAEGSGEWIEAKPERQRVIKQVHLLMPVKKSVFAYGRGDQLRQAALIKPEQRAKHAKRDPNALSRDDVIDGFWDEAFRLGLPRPQRVKI
jgi:hypothetical protein